MQTSRFQLGLIAILAVGLGFSLSSSDAVGYPAGAVVSMGANPIVSIGGRLTSGTSTTLFSADSGQDLIITDIVLTSDSNMECKRSHWTHLTHSGGATLGSFQTTTATGRKWNDHDSSGGDSVQHSFEAGLRVPAGNTVTMDVLETTNQGSGCGSSTSYGVHYAIAGYYAQQ